MGPRPVMRALQKLEDFNFISVERKIGAHNVYSLIKISEQPTPKPKETKPETPFVWSEYLERMKKDSRKDINIIGYFFEAKGVKFNSQEQVHVAIKRHLRDARELSAFEKPRIGSVIRQLAHDWPKFTLTTVIKELTK